jgi:uncharacterized protein YecE (DUF72 family)
VTADSDGAVPEKLPDTADWAYLRLRAPDYPDEALRSWKQRLGPFHHAFVYFKHEDGAAGPAFAARMLELQSGTGRKK